MSTLSRRISFVLLILAVLAAMLGAAILTARPAAAAAPSAATPSAPLEAPLNPAFLRYQAQFPLGTPQWVASGLGFGLRPDPVDLSYARGLAKSRAVDRAYPSSFDLRAINKVTSVKTQDPYGACWAFASLGSLESCLMPGQNLDFSEDNMVLTSGFDNPRKLVPQNQRTYYRSIANPRISVGMQITAANARDLNAQQDLTCSGGPGTRETLDAQI